MRIGIICRSLVLKSGTSGISNAILGWIPMWQGLGFSVDLIVDSPKILSNFYEIPDVTVYYPESPVSYGNHSNFFQFHDGFNFERSTNFRESLIKALFEKHYDFLIASEPESAFLLYQLGLPEYITCLYYCHEPGAFFKDSKLHVYWKQYIDLIDLIFKDFPIFKGLPSQTSKDFFPESPTIKVLPLPLPDINLLQERNIIQDGVLFNGRIEPRKNFDFWLECLNQIKIKWGVELRAKVLTKENHVQKALTKFSDIGYTNFDVRCNLWDDEKLDFISSAKVGFFPAIQETFGLAAFESLRFHPTVFLENYSWHNTFNGFRHKHLTPRSLAAQLIYDLHLGVENPNDPKAIVEFKKYHETCRDLWRKFFEDEVNLKRGSPGRNLFQKNLTDNWITWKEATGVLQKYLPNLYTIYKSNYTVADLGKNCFVRSGNSVVESDFPDISMEVIQHKDTQLSLF